MKSYGFVLLLLFITTFVNSEVDRSREFDPSRFRLVDQINGSFFVRGNLPIRNGSFVFEELYGELEKFTNSSGFKVVVISLLNFLTARETKSRYIEEQFFDHNGHHKYKGKVHEYKNFNIYGSYWSPAEWPSFLKPYAVRFYEQTSLDNIPTLVSYIRQNIETPKTIVFVHCSQGIDRAGYVSGAYKMKYKGAELKNVVMENLKIMREIRQHIHFNSFNGMQWYCLYLNRTESECLVEKNKANYLSSYEL